MRSPGGSNGSPIENASGDEWKKYWDSCNITEIDGTLEKLIQADRKRGLSRINLYIEIIRVQRDNKQNL